MSAARKPDRALQEATEQARARRLQQQAALDAKVKRAHGAGATDSEMVRELGETRRAVKSSRERQGLAPNQEALFMRGQGAGMAVAS